MRLFLGLLWCFLLLGLSAEGQTIKAFEKAGDKAFEQGDFFAASQYYKKALAIRKENLDIQYKFAQASQERKAFKTAERAYRYIATRPSEIEQFPLLHFHLGTVRKQQGNYKSAKKDFEKYLKLQGPSNPQLSARAKEEIEACAWAIRALEHPVKVEVILPKETIKSPWSEYSPFPKGDSLWYGALKFDHPEKKGQKVGRPLLFDGSNSTSLTDFAGAADHSGHLSFNDSLLVFTRCETVNVSTIRCALFYRIKENRQWTKPKALKLPTTFEGYSVSQPKLGIHPASGQQLVYFSSDAPSGKGGFDLWAGTWNNGQLTNLENLEALNTPQDEFSPAYHEAHQQLWFSSNRSAGFGGHDIYVSQWGEGNWQAAENAGAPINSSYDDLYFLLESDAMKAWWTSNRDGAQSLTKDEACCHDIFYGLFETPFAVPEFPDETEDIVQIPPITEPDTIPIATKQPEPFLPEEHTDPPPIEPIDIPIDPLIALGELLPLPLYFHNDEPDSNSYSLTTRIDYQTAYQFYISLEEKYINYFGQGDVQQAAAIQNFFDQEVKQNFEQLDDLALGLLDLLANGRKLELGIRGYTSPRAPSVYNDNLAKRRIVSVILFFKSFSDEAFMPYINNGQLQFTEVPYGEKQAPSTVEDAYDQPRLSIYSVDASRERRVEIVFLNEID
ncbi:MAG: hypothetical protein AAF598_06700 [Bacteroidota bacterium]